MSDAIPFPYDDPAWDDATDAFGKDNTRDLLQEITERWSDETADYLFFSALLHQETVYPATFLALPHVVALADTEPADRRRTMASFLGGVALHGQLPATSGGVSLAVGNTWAATSTGQRARDVFQACLPKIATVCETSYREDPTPYYASGLAAALEQTQLASWLTSGEDGGFTCPLCGGAVEWLMFGDRLAVYGGQSSLDDWRAGRPDHAVSIAAKGDPTPEVIALRDRLEPLDPVTSALLENYNATVSCPFCDWQGQIADTRPEP